MESLDNRKTRSDLGPTTPDREVWQGKGTKPQILPVMGENIGKNRGYLHILGANCY